MNSTSFYEIMSIYLISKTILIIFQIVSNASHALSDFSTTLNPNNNKQKDTGVISFDFSYPPSYPTGGDFGKGVIDLGGIEVHEALYFKKIWTIKSGGPDDFGVSFFEPSSIPLGFSLLGHYCNPNSKSIFSSVLTAKDTTGNLYWGSLRRPIDYTLIWTSKGLDINKDVDGYIWMPIPPFAYKAIGHIVTTSPEKPSLDMVRCVRKDFTDGITVDEWLWGLKMVDINIYTTKPNGGALSVPTGTFLARVNGSDMQELACLKMVRNDTYSAMPNSLQIKKMIEAYAPMVYLHPDEEYLPSSVLWFFQNGAELHRSGMIPWPVINDGVNLPSNSSVDGLYLDLPSDEAEKERVKKGFLPEATVYVHVKSALGATFTDLAIWLYYPFNGGGRFQLGPFTISLGMIGEHVSDWEHITLRIDNFNGILKSIYLSRHAAGVWVTPHEFEFMNGTRPIVYASLHGHSHYNTPSYHLHSTVEIDADDMKLLEEVLKMDSSKLPVVRAEKILGFGVRDDTGKSNNLMDIASSYQVVCVDYNVSYMEPWLNYTGRWGPKFSYTFTKEVIKIANHFPDKFKRLILRILNKLPAELLGEEGPEGPKMKESWTGDERT
uniref:Vacuolar protein sorting-associated protein 62 n=1 Tax=Lactuca sativa TaxID=4236 RepID=A0A9R1WN08_LACSA|nr:hypothetical protein LSAT_V11C100033990 [Lactuca sativa]